MCQHLNFDASVAVARIEDVGRFRAEVSIKCRDCGVPFLFQGLQPGYSAGGAHVSMDGLRADLPIAPEGAAPNPFQSMMHGAQVAH